VNGPNQIFGQIIIWYLLLFGPNICFGTVFDICTYLVLFLEFVFGIPEIAITKNILFFPNQLGKAWNHVLPAFILRFDG
jgi:hypothetical protein